MTSDLTSLKFGRDRRGGGDSGQPYFTKDIPERVRSINFGNSFLGNDFLIRGGTRAISAVLEDEVRLTKFLTSFKSPNGLLFIAKQELLAMQNPKTGVEKRIYNPLSTLAQAATNNIGLHFLKDSRMPLLGQDVPYEDKYIYKAQNPNVWNTNVTGPNTKNRLLLLYQTNIVTPLLLPAGTGLTSAQGIANITQFAKNLERFGIASKEDTEILFQYIGGPNAASKAALTTIRKSKNYNTNQGFIRNKDEAGPNQFLVYSPDLFNTDSLGDVSDPENLTFIGPSGPRSEIGPSFTKVLADQARSLGVSEDRKNELLGDPVDYKDINRATTFGEGNPGRKGRNRSVYYTTNLKNLGPSEAQNIFEYDKINARPLYSTATRTAVKETNKEDYIKFNIGLLDPNSLINSVTPIYTWIHFRAAITGFTDAYKASWNPVKYMGRSNKFWKYEGNDRNISMGFQIVVSSKYEQAFIYDKLNYLASITATNYSHTGWMRGNLIRLTVGDYLNNTMGILNSITYSIPNNSPWDIGRTSTGAEDPNSLQLPLLIDVTGFEFIPIHEFPDSVVPLSYTEHGTSVPTERYISMGPEGRGYKVTELERLANTEIKREN